MRSRSDPDNVRILEGRGIAYSNTGKDDLAIADYNAALQKRPTYAAPFNSRGYIYMRRGALQSALDDFAAAIRLAPNIILFPYVNRARVETMTRDYDAALADFAKAAEIDPNAPQIPTYRCVTYTAMGRFDEAFADCNNALEKFPKSGLIFNNRADAFMARAISTPR